eukprot:scaffold648196_cov42-Prasinocladus_malaysianus.AAC.1
MNWPARYYPEPSSIEKLTPAWHEAPKQKDVTMLFSFISDWNMIKEGLKEVSDRAAGMALKQHNNL